MALEWAPHDYPRYLHFKGFNSVKEQEVIDAFETLMATATSAMDFVREQNCVLSHSQTPHSTPSSTKIY